MSSERVKEIQEKTMRKKDENQLKEIISGKSKTNWEPEAIQAARKELEERSAPDEEEIINKLNDMTPNELLREQILTTRDLKESIDNLGLSSISSELREQTKKLSNISTAATLFIVLSFIAILVSFCS